MSFCSCASLSTFLLLAKHKSTQNRRVSLKEGRVFIPHRIHTFERRGTRVKVHIPTEADQCWMTSWYCCLQLCNWSPLSALSCCTLHKLEFSIKVTAYHVNNSTASENHPFHCNKNDIQVKDTEQKICIRLFGNRHHEKHFNLLLSNVGKIEALAWKKKVCILYATQTRLNLLYLLLTETQRWWHSLLHTERLHPHNNVNLCSQSCRSLIHVWNFVLIG